MHMSSGGTGFLWYLLRQPEHTLTFPDILHSTKGELKGAGCEDSDGGGPGARGDTFGNEYPQGAPIDGGGSGKPG